ncbi:MAG TPA: lipocalin family protein [Methylotenera sp.]|nr:lipocalin family protein [Methylotenera sp.]
MKRYIKIIMLSMLLLTACTGVPDGISPVKSLDANQYLGKWYEIARLDHSFERNLEKVTATYSLRDDGGINVTNRGFDSQQNEWKEAVGKAYFVEPQNADNTRTGRLKVSFFGPFYNAYNIIVLDKPYYNYVMICGPNKSYFWILSRTPQLAYPIKQELIAKAHELGFDTEKLIYVNQSDKPINYKAGPHINH